MMNTIRHGCALAALLALAACAKGPPNFAFFNQPQPPVSAALETADLNLSDLARYRGQPANAALALAQYDYIMRGFSSGSTFALGGPVEPQLVEGMREIYRALGVPAGTPPGTISGPLRSFASLQQQGQTNAALAALSQPFFTRGPQATFDTLNNLPSMLAVESVAPQIQRSANSGAQIRL